MRYGYNDICRTACLAVIAALLMLVSACAGFSKNRVISAEKQASVSFVIDFYQGPLNRLAAVRRGECPMYPSCSEYCRRAVEKHGHPIGWIMCVDRLIRCGRDELDSAPRIYVSGKFRVFDPVENNDFWWNP